MKKFVFASVLALAAGGMLIAPALRAQDITIKDPAEFNSYSMATGQADPRPRRRLWKAFCRTIRRA